jgi:hypothetical protein
MPGKRIKDLPPKPAQLGDHLAVDGLVQGTYRVSLGQNSGVPFLNANGALADSRAYLNRGNIQFDGADWNTVTASGVYEVDASGSGGANFPPTFRKQGSLIVYAAANTVVQLYVPNSPGDIYIRTSYNNIFGAWQTVGSGGGGGGLTAFEHIQNTPATTWTINHNLGYYPDIHVYSSGGSEVTAEIVHVSANQALIYFSAPTTGRARCV